MSGVVQQKMEQSKGRQFFSRLREAVTHAEAKRSKAESLERLRLRCEDDLRDQLRETNLQLKDFVTEHSCDNDASGHATLVYREGETPIKWAYPGGYSTDGGLLLAEKFRA